MLANYAIVVLILLFMFIRFCPCACAIGHRIWRIARDSKRDFVGPPQPAQPPSAAPEHRATSRTFSSLLQAQRRLIESNAFKHVKEVLWVVPHEHTDPDEQIFFGASIDEIIELAQERSERPSLIYSPRDDGTYDIVLKD